MSVAICVGAERVTLVPLGTIETLRSAVGLAIRLALCKVLHYPEKTSPLGDYVSHRTQSRRGQIGSECSRARGSSGVSVLLLQRVKLTHDRYFFL